MAAIMQGKVRPSYAQLMGVALLFFFLILSPSSMAQDCKGKNSWPELVGFYGRIAPPIIKFQNPHVKEVDLVKEGSMVTMDFRCDRVRVWVKPSGIIYEAPTIG